MANRLCLPAAAGQCSPPKMYPRGIRGGWVGCRDLPGSWVFAVGQSTNSSANVATWCCRLSGLHNCHKTQRGAHRSAFLQGELKWLDGLLLTLTEVEDQFQMGDASRY